MAISEWFTWLAGTSSNTELPEIFPFPIDQTKFVSTDIVTIYAKILTDVVERTDGLSDDQVALMWDNCVKSSATDGLVSLLSKAMAEKKELYLVYEKAVDVVRVAVSAEQEQIKADYAKSGESKVGVYVSFKNYTRSDMIKLYVGLDFCTVGSLWKSMNLSRALQIKILDLRKSVALGDSIKAEEQGQNIARGLGQGTAVMLDAGDLIETAKPDLAATEESVKFVTKKLSFYTGLPDSYFTGEQTSGIGSTGESDMRATERGLKGYYYSIIKPVADSLFGTKTTYKSQDFRAVSGAMEVLKTFALVDEELISVENKTMIINQLLGLPEDAEGDGPAPTPEVVAVPPGASPAPKPPVPPVQK